LGEYTEHLLAPGISRCFEKLGYEFETDDLRRLKIKDDQNRVLSEIDFLFENDETYLLVEIKSKPSLSDVESHVKRLTIFKRYLKDEGHELKDIIGAVGGVVFAPNIRVVTLKAGLFVITHKGNDVQIDVPDNFVPKFF
jgi:hypothetical protein